MSGLHIDRRLARLGQLLTAEQIRDVPVYKYDGRMTMLVAGRLPSECSELLAWSGAQRRYPAVVVTMRPIGVDPAWR